MKKPDKKLEAFLRDVLKLPYKPNPQDNPEHENQVGDLLKKHKIKYKAQPNGSQEFPDFHLEEYDIDLECKSIQGKKPKLNSNLPKPNVVYILASGKADKINIFFGQDVCPTKFKKFLEDNMVAYIKYVKEMNKKLLIITPGWSIYPRKDYLTNKLGPDFLDESLAEKVFKHFGFNYEV